MLIPYKHASSFTKLLCLHLSSWSWQAMARAPRSTLAQVYVLFLRSLASVLPLVYAATYFQPLEVAFELRYAYAE